MVIWNKYIEQFNEGLPKELKLRRRRSKVIESKELDKYNKHINSEENIR